jgi:hypothetical protein
MEGDRVPDHVARLPARPSLEQLRKQAKDLLARARAGDVEALAMLGRQPATASLSDAQRALARHYGFSSWPELRREVERLRPREVAGYERIAEELADAYAAGDPAAVRDINWTFGTDFRRERSADALQRQLPAWYASTSRERRLAIADARLIVARAFGQESWGALAEHVGRKSEAAAPAVVGARPIPFLAIDRAEGRITVKGPLAPADWDTIAALLEEQGLSRLSARGIDDAGMRRLAGVAAITHLEIGDSKRLTDEGAAALFDMPQLLDLELGGAGSPLTDRALAALPRLTELRRFRTYWTPGFSDRGVAGLAGCEALEEVRLLGTPTGDGALRALAGKPKLRLLSTGRNVTDLGLELLRELPVFARWRGGEEAYDLVSADVGPNELVVDGPFTDAGAAVLGELEGVFALSFFWHSQLYTAAALTPLRALPHLSVFGCSGERCDDAMTKAVVALPRLRKLLAQGAVATDAGFAALSRSATLEHFWGREAPNLTGRGFAALATMPSLRGLAISCRNIDDASLALLPGFPALSDFVPIDFSDADFAHIGRCAELQRLWCMYCRETGDEATGHIRQLGLKSYYAGMTRITDRSLELLGRMETLERVQLWHCAHVSETGVAALGRLPRLAEVALHGLPAVSPAVAGSFRPNVRVTYSG